MSGYSFTISRVDGVINKPKLITIIPGYSAKSFREAHDEFLKGVRKSKDKHNREFSKIKADIDDFNK